MKKLTLGLVALTALTALSSCNEKSVKTEQLSRVVWSDDNSEQALVVMRYEEATPAMNPISAGGLESNFSHQIYIQNADGSKRHAVGIEFQGQSGFDLYYMKEAGYIVATMMENDESNQPVTRYFQLWMDGTVSRLTDKPDMKIIPSPDGQILAQVTQYPATCQNPAGNCPVDVSFIDATSHDSLGKKIQANFSGGQLPAMTWNTQGEFILAGATQAQALTPGSSEIRSVPIPACTYPPTSSSQVAANGAYIYSSAGSILSRPAAQNEASFGCQG